MLTSAYSDMSYNDVIKEIDKFKKGELDADIFVVDVREPEEIDRLVKATKAFTIFIENNRVPSITSNPADANVENYKYDFVIQNNGTLEDFEYNIKLFMEVLMTFMLMYEDRF